MDKHILGAESAYKYAMDKRRGNMVIAVSLVIDLIQRIDDLEGQISDAKLPKKRVKKK